MRDAERALVYSAEDRWSLLLDNGGTLDLFGSRLDLPVQKRFGSLEAMQTYVDAVLSMPGIDGAPVHVRERAGQRRAHYEPAGAVIAIPMEERWAAREAVVLHELAHHCACVDNGELGHGPDYRRWMLMLVERVLGPQATLVLRVGYEDAGLPV